MLSWIMLGLSVISTRASRDETLSWAPIVDQFPKEIFFKVFKSTKFTNLLTPNIFFKCFVFFCLNEGFQEIRQNIH